MQTILSFILDFGIHTVPKNIETTKPEIPCKMDLSDVLGPCTEKIIPAQNQLSTILTKTHDFGQTSTDEQSAILGSTTPLNSSFSYPSIIVPSKLTVTHLRHDVRRLECLNMGRAQVEFVTRWSHANLAKGPYKYLYC